MIGAREAWLSAAAVLAAACPAAAHPFNVYATTDCVTITVQATINDGQAPAEGIVTLLNGDDVVVATGELVGDTGMAEMPLEGLDVTGGIRVEVVSGAHSDYWVLTPDDIRRGCNS